MPNEVIVDDTKKDELSNISVKMDETGKPLKEEKKEEPKYVRLEDLERLSKAIDNTRDYGNRRVASLETKIDQLLRTQPQFQPQSQPKPEPTEWDTKLQKDWKGTVEELAEARFNQLMQRQQNEQRIEYERQQSMSLLENNKRRVLDKHKELNDEGSDKANAYRQVLNEHPEYLSNPFGPVLAMRDMEDKLRDQGIVDEPTKQIVQKEINRQVRAGAGAIPTGSTNPNKSKTVTLTKDQKEYCDLKGIKYDNYAKYVGQINAKGSVEA